MSIKSKKWYQNQIKCLENATDKLHSESVRLGDCYLNDLPGFYKTNKPLKDNFDKLKNRLNKLKDEFHLYYK